MNLEIEAACLLKINLTQTNKKIMVKKLLRRLVCRYSLIPSNSYEASRTTLGGRNGLVDEFGDQRD